MTDSSILEMLDRLGAIITESHVVYTSGRHSSSYVNKDTLFPHTAETSLVCAALARQFLDAGVNVVAGPTMGGALMAQWVANHLTELSGQPVLAVYAEEEGVTGHRVFRRGYSDLVHGKRVLVVEDVLTTGGPVRKVITAVQSVGGVIAGVGALCNRGQATAATLGVSRYHALVQVSLESWDADDCPLCKAQVPINTRVGRGAEFLAQHPRQPEQQP